MIRYKILAALLLISFIARAQDTLTVLQYNLLYYGENTDWCNSSNNNINDKDEYLKTIINYVQPDIFAVNEMSKSPSIHLHLLDQVLNADGNDTYEKANFIAEAGSDIVNMLYYNKEILALHSHLIAQNYIRDIDVYKLYHLSEDLQRGDTAFVICVVAHLKASSGNENKRKVMAENTMDFLNDYDDDNNYLMMGDFNVYTASEPAYQEFLFYENTNLRFIDPVNKYGDWNNNYFFRDYHTQSTHENSNGCAAGGGIDDRFDFILISNNIKQGTKQVKYVPGSYWAIGQDGQHFNKSINASPANNSVPSDVLHALFHNSDHLPVTLKILVGEQVGVEDPFYALEFHLVNPISETLQFSLKLIESKAIQLQIVDLTGKIQMTENFSVSTDQFHYSIPVNNLRSGFYTVRILENNKLLVSRKVVKI